MKTEYRIRDISIRLIQILVLFEILWAAIFVVGLTFKWSGLTDQLTSAFFGAGFCSLILTVALAVLNVATNLNIISRTVGAKVLAVDSPAPPSRSSSWRLLAGAGVLVALVLGALAIAETRLYRLKKSEIEAKIESIADTQLVSSVIVAVRNDSKVSELRQLREAIAVAIQTGDRISLLIPRDSHGGRAYYEFTGWWGGKEEEKIGEASLPRFVPSLNEQDDFAELVEGKKDHFSLKSGSEIRSFRRIKKQDGEIIILIDTNRQYGDRKFSREG